MGDWLSASDFERYSVASLLTPDPSLRAGISTTVAAAAAAVPACPPLVAMAEQSSYQSPSYSVGPSYAVIEHGSYLSAPMPGLPIVAARACGACAPLQSAAVTSPQAGTPLSPAGGAGKRARRRRASAPEAVPPSDAGAVGALEPGRVARARQPPASTALVQASSCRSAAQPVPRVDSSDAEMEAALEAELEAQMEADEEEQPEAGSDRDELEEVEA